MEKPNPTTFSCNFISTLVNFVFAAGNELFSPKPHHWTPTYLQLTSYSGFSAQYCSRKVVQSPVLIDHTPFNMAAHVTKTPNLGQRLDFLITVSGTFDCPLSSTQWCAADGLHTPFPRASRLKNLSPDVQPQWDCCYFDVTLVCLAEWSEPPRPHQQVRQNPMYAGSSRARPL